MTAPFGQLHVLATQSLDDMWYPASHVPLTQMVAPSDVQLAPVAAVPYVQLHVLASHVVPSLDRWYGPAQLAHMPPPCVGHASPDVCTPLAHVHCFVAHCRFCVLLGATVWYSALLQVVHATQASLRR